MEAVGAAEGIFGDDEIGGGDGEGEDGEVAVDRGDGLARGEGPETDGRVGGAGGDEVIGGGEGGD